MSTTLGGGQVRVSTFMDLVERAALKHPDASVWLLERDKEEPIDSDDAFLYHAVVGLDVDDEEPSVDLETEPDDQAPGFTVSDLARELQKVEALRGEHMVFGSVRVFEDGVNGMAWDIPVVAADFDDEDFWAFMRFENCEAEIARQFG